MVPDTFSPSSFEFGLLAGTNTQNRHLKNHD